MPIMMPSLLAAALPWWQTWWLWALALASGIAAGAVFHRSRLRAAEELVRQRTAEVAAKQEVLERQNKRLEVNNTIVKFVNARIGFSDLLETILEGILFVQSADRALALAVTDELDQFAIQAAAGWSYGNPRQLTLERGDIEEAYLERAAQVAPGIWIGAPSASPLAAEEERVGSLAKEVLVMRIEIEDEVAGYLVVHHLRDGETFDRDLDGLQDLKEHMASAFLKGRMLEELRELNEKKNEFLGVAAHDLRNPLTGVIGYSDLLLRFLDQEGVERPRWRRFLENIQSLADDMRTMVNQLLDVTAIETGKVEMCIERRRLSGLLADCNELHVGAAREKNIDLELDTTAAGIDVMIDRVRVAEVLDNLVSNAIKFTWPGGRVRVFCEVDGGEVVTHVEDTGQGLEARELDEVFSGKKLSARPTAGEPSTGLGLVIVKKVVELHRGRTWVVSEKGVGSTFSFSLPQPAAAPPNPAGPEVHAPTH